MTPRQLAYLESLARREECVRRLLMELGLYQNEMGVLLRLESVALHGLTKGDCMDALRTVHDGIRDLLKRRLDWKETTP